MTNPNCVAFYLRVSTKEQVNGFSLQAQEELLRKELNKLGKAVYKVYIDAGISGTTRNRKGLKNLLKDAKSGYFNEVLIWRISRLSRNLHDLLEVIAELKGYQVSLRSISENIDLSSPLGQFTLTMMGAVAEMERESWVESNKIAIEERVKSGLWSGRIAFGYKSVNVQGKRNQTHLEIIPEEASIIKEIFSMYSNSYGIKAITIYLNKKGIKSKEGKAFSLYTIRAILNNPIYIGYLRFKGEIYKGVHQPIVDEQLWNSVQEIKQKRSKKAPKHFSREYLLSGILRCPQCGGSMIPQHVKNKRKDGSYRINHYYICNKYHNQGISVCKPNSVPALEAEEKVMNWLEEFIFQPNILNDILEEIKERNLGIQKGNGNNLTALSTQIKDVEKLQQELIRLYEDDKIARDEFLKQLTQYKLEKEKLLFKLDKQQLDKVDNKMLLNEVNVMELVASLKKSWFNISLQRKVQVIRAAINKVTVNEQRKVDVIETIFCSVKL